jgi:hypothetical protein
MPEEIILQPQEDEGSKGPVDEAQVTELKGGKGEGSETEEEIAAAAAEAAKKVEEEGAKPLTAEELLAQRDSENNELRTLLRDGKRTTDALTERMAASEAALEKAGLVSEEEKKAAADQRIAFSAREKDLEVILEVTRLNSKYEDVDTVVSQGNFDQAIESMANEYAVKNGVPRSDAVEAVEGWVWSLTNPYRFMYDKIKEIHPSFTGKGKGKGDPAEAPGSLQGVHGGTGGDDLTGWTSAKIDGLPEDKLSTVPKDVYAKYLRNELK